MFCQSGWNIAGLGFSLPFVSCHIYEFQLYRFCRFFRILLSTRRNKMEQIQLSVHNLTAWLTDRTKKLLLKIRQLNPLFLIALLYQKKEKIANGLKSAMVFLTVDNFFAETGYMAVFMDIQLLYEALFPGNRPIPYFRNGTGRLFGRLIHFLSGKWSFTDKLSTGAIFRKKFFLCFSQKIMNSWSLLSVSIQSFIKQHPPIRFFDKNLDPVTTLSTE